MQLKKNKKKKILLMKKKKKKKKKKIIEKKVSFCTFGLEVLVYNNNHCHLVQIKSVM
jgi:hypothetical protein